MVSGTVAPITLHAYSTDAALYHCGIALLRDVHCANLTCRACAPARVLSLGSLGARVDSFGAPYAALLLPMVLMAHALIGQSDGLCPVVARATAP